MTGDEKQGSETEKSSPSNAHRILNRPDASGEGDMRDVPGFDPIYIKGEPLSATVLRERR